jgi:hypothetical protein
MTISEMAEGYRGKDDRYQFHFYNLGIFEPASLGAISNKHNTFSE